MEPSTSKKRRAFSIEQKAAIIKKIQLGCSNSEVAKQYDVSHSTISTIWKKRDSTQKAFECQSLKTKKLRYSTNCNIEEALLKWFKMQRNKNVPISGPILLTKAEEIGKLLNKNFKCSESWIFRFRKRHNIVLGKISGESASVEGAASDEWLSSVWPKLRERYAPSEIFNIDETGLFYKMTPDKTFKFKGEKCVGGKMSKDRITVLVGANMDGTEKCKLVVIGKSKSPRCFKSIKCLPVDYTGNKRAWMTSDIFEGCLRKWDTELKQSNRKILLLVDNCPAHPHVENLKNIKLAFLPPNTSSVLQPMDQGVIKSLKGHYRRNLLLKIVRNVDSDKNTAVSLIDAIEMVATAWNRVTTQTIANCFKHAGFSSAADLDTDSAIYDENDEIPLVEWTQLSTTLTSNVCSEEYWDDFIMVDNCVMTNEEPTLKDIVGDIVDASNKNNQMEIEDVTDDSVEVISPTLNEAYDALSTVKRFLTFNNWPIELTASVLSIERKFEEEYLKNKRQTTMPEFFTKIQKD